jgi:hypothetical protein
LAVDFAIFGALADVIGAELFPVDTASKQLLKGLGKNVILASKEQDTDLTHFAFLHMQLCLELRF